MKRFTKRTIALVMASVVTVVGAFGANNYKNCLMGLKFDNTPNGEVNMVLQTKSLYKNDMILRKKDLNTYILTLPDPVTLKRFFAPLCDFILGMIVSPFIVFRYYSAFALLPLLLGI